MRHRMSSLALANICPKSPLLSATYGASIEALKGQAFHAIQHKERTAQLILNSLPEDAREEVLSWKPPPTLTFQERGETVVLDYSQAKHEVLVCLSRLGTACATTDPKLATEGHVDAFWIVQFQDGTRIAYVGDIKKSAFTSVDGPDSLQLMAYGLAVASAERCHGFTTGLYIAETGEWQWSHRYHELDSDETLAILEQVLYAAANEGDAVTGLHCSNCFGRLHCPEFLLPAALNISTELAPLSEASAGELTNDQALVALRFYLSAKPLLERVYSNLKVFAERSGGIRDASAGTAWVPVTCKGRESCNLASLREALGEAAEAHISRGQPYTMMKVRKVKP